MKGSTNKRIDFWKQIDYEVSSLIILVSTVEIVLATVFIVESLSTGRVPGECRRAPSFDADKVPRVKIAPPLVDTPYHERNNRKTPIRRRLL